MYLRRKNNLDEWKHAKNLRPSAGSEPAHLLTCRADAFPIRTHAIFGHYFCTRLKFAASNSTCDEDFARFILAASPLRTLPAKERKFLHATSSHSIIRAINP